MRRLKQSQLLSRHYFSLFLYLQGKFNFKHISQLEILNLLKAIMAKQKKEIKEKPIELTLWESANKLRGGVDSAEYKHVVLGISGVFACSTLPFLTLGQFSRHCLLN
ncbi:MAG: hypothetical protein K0B09_10870 [Bacteroidales bacterium]|nr:hypothetical protein [Bacteroidales bacterium]